MVWGDPYGETGLIAQYMGHPLWYGVPLLVRQDLLNNTLAIHYGLGCPFW